MGKIACMALGAYLFLCAILAVAYVTRKDEPVEEPFTVASEKVETEATEFAPTLTAEEAFIQYADAIRAGDGLDVAEGKARTAVMDATTARNEAVTKLNKERAEILALCRAACESNEAGDAAFAATRAKLAASRPMLEAALAEEEKSDNLQEAFYAAEQANRVAQKKIVEAREQLWITVGRHAADGQEGEMFKQTELGFVKNLRAANPDNQELVAACDKYEAALQAANVAGAELAKLVPDADALVAKLDREKHATFGVFDKQARAVLEKNAGEVTEADYAALKEAGKAFSAVLNTITECKAARDKYQASRQTLDEALLNVIRLSK